MMTLSQDIIDGGYSDTFGAISSLYDLMNKTLQDLNEIIYTILRYGNVLIFLAFLLMGLQLLVSAREIRYKELLNSRNIEFIKKRGRIGTIVCVSLSFFKFFFSLNTLN